MPHGGTLALTQTQHFTCDSMLHILHMQEYIHGLGFNYCPQNLKIILYTDKQLVHNKICLLLSTGLYIRAFEDSDLLAKVNQTWVELQCIINEAFQRRLNAMAPTTRHQGYNPPPSLTCPMHWTLLLRRMMTTTPLRPLLHRWLL